MADLLSPNKLILLVFFLVPGFVANRVYSLRCPSVKTEPEKMILEYLTYSLFNLFLWSSLVLPFARTPIEQWNPWETTFIGLWVCFIFPAIMALVWVWLRKNVLHHRFGMDHPTPKGWDYFLTHYGEFWVLFHLKNGKMVGGFFGRKSFAATYPQEPELYVEQVWRVNKRGQFVEMVSGTIGSVVRQSEWDRVEFFEVKREVSDAGQEQGTTAGGSKRELPTGSGGVGGTGPAWTADEQQCGTGPTDPAAGGIGNSAPAGEQTTTQVGAEYAGDTEERVRR